MSRLKKIVFIIIVFLICISVHNVSLSATDNWLKEGGFTLTGKTCTEGHSNCTVYKLPAKNKEVHITTKGYHKDSEEPHVGNGSATGDNNMICFQDDLTASKPLAGGHASEIQYKMSITGNTVTVTPISANALDKSKKSLSYSSKLVKVVAYCLSEMSTGESSWTNRHENGAQVALWRVIDSFLQGIKQQNPEFYYVDAPGMYDKKYENTNSKRIYKEAKAYADCEDMATSKNETDVSVSVLKDGDYKIGPFNVNFASASVSSKKIAGFVSATLKMDKVKITDGWYLCDENGEKLANNEPTSGIDFYVRVDKTQQIGSNVSLTIKTKKMQVDAIFYTQNSKGGKQHEAFVIAANRSYINEQVTIGAETIGNLRIEKEDADSGKKLSGVGFTIQDSSNNYLKVLNNGNVQTSATGIINLKFQTTTKEADATIFYTNDNGIIELHNIPIDTYKVKEVSVGNRYGYIPNAENISVTITAKPYTNTPDLLPNESVTIVTAKNKKQVGQLQIEKVDSRNEKKKLARVEFRIKSSASNNQYIKVKASGSNITNDAQGWATRIVGTAKINDTTDTKNNPTLGYTSSANEATVFVTDSVGKINISNLLSSLDGNESIKYTLEEINNPNYGYLSANTGQKVNYNVVYKGESTTKDGIVTLTTSNTITVTATNEQDYIRIEGIVWEEIAVSKGNFSNDFYNDTDALIKGIKVYLFKGGTQIADTTTDENGWYQFGSKDKDSYTYDDYTNEKNGNLKIADLSSYHIEFEYDGLRFTSVAVDNNYSSTNYNISSKAQEVPSGREDKKDRETVNNDFAIITNDKSSNSSGNRGYELDYSFENNKSTYIDKWEYKYTDKTRLQVTTAKNSEYAIIASTKTAKYDLKDAWNAQCNSITSGSLSGINLGIKRREQADLAIGSDLHKVNIKINKTDGESYENTYTYENRKIDSDTYDFGIETKFGTKVGSYSNRGLNTYTRRIYESDLAYNNNQSLMEIYVTYRIRVKNQSTALYTKVNEIANYYDNRYDIETSWIGDSETNTIEWKNTSNASQNINIAEGYKVGYTEGIKNITINPNGYVDIYIKFKLNSDAVNDLVSKQTTLNNVSEITSFSTVDQNKNPYAAIDEDSNPGNAKIKLSDTTSKKTKLNNRDYEIETKTLDSTTYEDDTDWAPSLVIGIQESDPTRGLSGTVFEDMQTEESAKKNERLGDGIFDAKENKIKYAKVELLEYDTNEENHIAKDENGNAKIATLYKINNDTSSFDKEPAVKYTDENGEYEFKGVIPGRYLIRYTYGTFETKDENGNVTKTDTTSIITTDGEEIQINVRDYKSTIITSDIIEKALNLEQKKNSEKGEREGNYNWILEYEKNGDKIIRYSDAVDDINKRNDEDDLYYGKYINGKIGNSQMTADTAFFDIGVEYSTVDELNKTNTNYDKEYNMKENEPILVFNEEGKIVLANTLYAVNPYQDFGIIERARQDYEVNKRVSDLKITLSNGQVLINGNPYTGNLSYVKALPSGVIAEIDNEIVQKAKLEIEYTIAIKNNSEKDDDYRQNKDYYFYGGTIKNPITAAITKVVDYMEDGLIYNDQENQGKGWTKVTAGDLKKYSEEENGVKIEKQLISEDVYNDIKQGYTIATTDQFNNIAVGDKRDVQIYASKVLTANGTEVENHVEIIETKGIRAIKDSTPGNYSPKDAKPDEPDDDKTKLIITPPTGLPDNKILIITVTTISLLVLATGIYFIKKKIL